MAAVQSVYRAAVAQEELAPKKQVASLQKQLENNKEEQKLLGLSGEPNYALLQTILEGVQTNTDEIELRLSGALSEGWSRARLSPLMAALLQCGIYELFFYKDLKPKIVIDEYTKIARSFFSEAEVNFVHGALSTLAAQYSI